MSLFFLKNIFYSVVHAIFCQLHFPISKILHNNNTNQSAFPKISVKDVSYKYSQIIKQKTT